MEIKDIISSGLLEAYALGIATPEESQQVEQWLAKYPEVASEFNDIQQGLENYAMASAQAPSPAVKEKIFSNIQSSPVRKVQVDLPGKSKVIMIAPFWRKLAAASIILLIGSLILNMVYVNKYRDANRQFAEANDAYLKTKNELALQTDKLEAMDRDMSVVQNKYSQPVSLNGLPTAPDAAAKIFWMKNTGEVFIDPSNLPAPPAGKQYQLWGIVDGKPVDGGMILYGEKGKYHIQKMKTFGKAEAFAVTLEDEGGHPQPKGQMYVLGKM